MNLELLKELKDLKAVQNDLYLQLNKKLTTKKLELIASGFNSFKSFFEEKGFQVNTINSTIFASYGNLKAELKHEDPSVLYVGTYLPFDLQLQLPIKTDFRILLTHKENLDHKPEFAPDNQIDKQIQEAKYSIERVQSRIQNLTNEKWVFMLYDRKDNKRFDSIYNLLKSLTTKQSQS